MTIIEITRKIEFDAGHRIPDHASKCCNVHGHRYVLEATLRGTVNPTRRKSDDGMIMDFGKLKELMTTLIGDKWDHAFLCCDWDPLATAIPHLLGEHQRTVILDFVPTAENLCRHAFSILAAALQGCTNFELVHVRLYETPNCWSDCYNTSTQPERSK